MSGYAATSTAIEPFDQAELLVKPVPHQRLLSAVARVLDRRLTKPTIVGRRALPRQADPVGDRPLDLDLLIAARDGERAGAVGRSDQPASTATITAAGRSRRSGDP